MKPIAHNFRTVAGAPIQTLEVAALVAMLDREQEAKFALVSKWVGPLHVTTAYDIDEHRVLRSAHETGMFTFWKGVGRRRPNVQVLAKNQTYYPA